MTAANLDHKDEQELLESIKRASALVDEGLSPDEALMKIAREMDFGPGRIGVLAAAYNTGRQLAQWNDGAGVLDKLASFDLADAKKITAALYPDEVLSEKEAALRHGVDDDYDHGPYWLEDMRRAKSASAILPPMIEKTAEVAETYRDPKKEMQRAFGRWERTKQAFEEARRTATAAEDRYRVKMARLFDYFRKAPGERVSLAQAEHVSSIYFGKIASDLFDAVAAVLPSSEARPAEKRAADIDLQPGEIDLDRNPYRLIRECFDSAKGFLKAAKVRDAAEETMKKAKEEHLRPFGLGEKEAGVFAPMGTAFGTWLGRTVGELPKSKGELVEDAAMELEDPRHQNEIRRIKAQAMLNAFLTDDEDPISGHDPELVLEHYNRLAQLAPRAAEQPAVIGPLLRKSLTGKMEPFEAKEIAGLEKDIAGSRIGRFSDASETMP